MVKSINLYKSLYNLNILKLIKIGCNTHKCYLINCFGWVVDKMCKITIIKVRLANRFLPKKGLYIKRYNKIAET